MSLLSLSKNKNLDINQLFFQNNDITILHYNYNLTKTNPD